MFFNFLTVYYNTVAERLTGVFLITFLEFLNNWWWLVLSFVLIKPFLFFWHWWRFEVFLKNVFRPLLLEIKIPRDIAKPVRAMEDVMASLHSVLYHVPDWWEEWVEGQFQTSLGLEIVSIGGKIHFYMRVHKGYRHAAEAAIYSHYPDVEITEVDDYAKAVPQDVPNKEWDLWATDYVLLRNKLGENAYPILTYKSFEKEQEPVEERIVDPMSALMEGMAKIGPGEQLWIQIAAMPITEKESDWISLGKELRDKLAKRTESEEETPQFKKPMLLEAAEILIEGKFPEEPKKPEKEMMFPPELRLTPGERDIVAAVEQKISKQGFVTNIRFIYLGKRENFVKDKLRIPFTFFGSFYTHNLNALIPWGNTLSKIKKSWFLPLNLLRPKRVYLRKRKIFRYYVNRLPSYFPRSSGVTKFILNIEELASLFHFPSWRVAPVPGVARIEAKKKAPPELPKE